MEERNALSDAIIKKSGGLSVLRAELEQVKARNERRENGSQVCMTSNRSYETTCPCRLCQSRNGGRDESTRRPE